MSEVAMTTAALALLSIFWAERETAASGGGGVALGVLALGIVGSGTIASVSVVAVNDPFTNGISGAALCGHRNRRILNAPPALKHRTEIASLGFCVSMGFDNNNESS